MNTDDNQGVRYLLLPRLLRSGRRDEAAAIFEAYPDDAGAGLPYCRALMEFQAGGDAEAARHALAAAVAANRFVPEFLLNPVDEDIEHFRLGREEEAIVTATEMDAAWRATPGALEWLDRQVQAMRAEKRGATRRQGSGGDRRSNRASGDPQRLDPD